MSAVFARRRDTAAFTIPPEATARAAPRAPVPSSWHESSLDLRRGLVVVEHATMEAALAAARPPVRDTPQGDDRPTG